MKNNYKFWIVLSFIAVFAAGVAGGVLFENNFLDKKPRRDGEKRSSVRFPTLEMMAEELNLSSEQQEKLREIFKNNEERINTLRSQIHDQYATLRSQLKEEMDQVFTEDQQTQFEAMIEKYLAERKREMDKRNKRPPKDDLTDKGERR